ncbi:hypothetical protein BYT27DRAFT_7195671 [Phlegmacium glaucopus]|nr:hypothetical protein BYT27DRAFT_7195671 [Phlegmacium glaucopus]
MSLTKIPFIVLETWAFNRSITAPNPPPPKDERITSQVPMENASWVKWMPYIASLLQLFVAAAEIATILASATPSWTLSQLFLSLFIWRGGKPDNLRLTKVAALGVLVMVLGTWIRMMTYRHLGRFFRFEASIQKDHELIVSGPYAVVRHPSYTGLVMVFFAWFPWQLGKGTWIMESGLWNTVLGRILVVTYFTVFNLATSYLVLERMSKEDAALRKQFGTKWDEWAEKVPYSVFPGIY